MPTLQMCMHPGVVQENGIAFRRNRSAHLRQGELASSCGLLSILMATIVLGIATKPYVRQLRYGQEGDLLMPLWTTAQETFFLGANHDDMQTLLDTIDLYVHRQVEQGSMRKLLDFTLARLAEGYVVILGFGDRGVPGPDHWALAVGVLSKVSGVREVPAGVLCLDAADAAPTLAPFNAQLELDSPRRGARQLTYRGADGRPLLMTVTSAIALSRR